MLNKILDLLIPQSNGHIITNSRLKESVKNKMNSGVEVIDDIRSATFFAFGEGKISGKPSILIIDEQDCASTYTGITEAHYQDVPIFIVLISKNEFWKFWDFCVEKKYIVNNDSDLENIVQIVDTKFFSPIVIKTYIDDQYDLRLPKIKINLEKILENKSEIFIHNIEYYSQADNVHLDNKSKYGIISRYVGHIQFSNSKDILICREEDLKLDINIFGSRYINDKFKAVVISDGHNVYDFKKWITSNNVIYDEEQELKEDDIKKLLNSNKAHLILIKGEEQ